MARTIAQKKVADKARQRCLRTASARTRKRLETARRKRIDIAQKGAVLGRGPLKYQVAQRVKGIVDGGVPLMLKLAREIGLLEAIDRRLKLLTLHLPYRESDHVLNLALNPLCGGTCLQDIERQRRDVNFLDAIGAAALPGASTAGDFCRRFAPSDIHTLLDVINETRLAVWKQQDDSFFDEALIDCDGVYVSTTGECKVGMDVNYKNEWGYHPLLVSLANTQEPLFIVNRKGNRPSEEDAAIWLDKAIAVCRRGGFRRIRLRGDTAFSQTKYLDAWNAQGTLFQFGYDSMANVRELAENLGDSHWKRLQRPDKYTIRTEPRAQPENVKQRIVRERGYENLVLQYEDVGEFEYQPTLCKKSYRMVVVRKLITHERGTELLFPETRYLFYITNDWQQTPSQIVFGCNDRCDQENLNSHLKSGVRCLTAPVDNLESNWAYMVCTSLAWTLKAWAALLLPATQGDDATSAQQTQERRRWLRMEFKTFARAVLQLPCQVVKQAGAVICRVLNWNEHLEAFFRLSDLLTSGELRRQLRANRCQQE